MSDTSVSVSHEDAPKNEGEETPVETPEETPEEPVHAFTQAAADQSESVSVSGGESPKASEPVPPKSNVQAAREHLLNALEALDNELEQS